MPDNIMDTVRSRIEETRTRVTSGRGMIRDRLQSIRGQQGGIIERIGERFPALKRVRGSIEPWQRPALFERGGRETQKEAGPQGLLQQKIAGGREMRPPTEPAIF